MNIQDLKALEKRLDLMGKCLEHQDYMSCGVNLGILIGRTKKQIEDLEKEIENA